MGGVKYEDNERPNERKKKKHTFVVWPIGRPSRPIPSAPQALLLRQTPSSNSRMKSEHGRSGHTPQVRHFAHHLELQLSSMLPHERHQPFCQHDLFRLDGGQLVKLGSDFGECGRDLFGRGGIENGGDVGVRGR